MAQQTEQRAVINGRNYVGFVIPGQFITIYRADDEFKPLNDGLDHFVNRLGDVEMNQAMPSTVNRLAATLKALFRDFTIPPMSIISLVLAALMLIAGVLLLVDAPALGPLMGGIVFGSAILLVLFAIFGPFLW
jgi:hypothetical protein